MSIMKENKPISQTPFIFPLRDHLDILSLPYFDNWFIGFIEAEGSFVIRQNGRISFSISQTTDRDLLFAILHRLNVPHYKVQASPRTNKILYLIQIFDKKALYTLVDILYSPLTANLIGQKAVSYATWKTLLI